MPNKIDVLWDDNPVDITAEANFIWSIANKLRGSYMPDYSGLRGLLVTKDAHTLYERYGYETINNRAMMKSPC